jgi:hypothetical protein
MSDATWTERTAAKETAENAQRPSGAAPDGDAPREAAEQILRLSKDLNDGNYTVNAFLEVVGRIVRKIHFGFADPNCVLDLITSLQPSPSGVDSPFALYGTAASGLGNHVRCYMLGPTGRVPTDPTIYLQEADYAGTSWALTPVAPPANQPPTPYQLVVEIVDTGTVPPMLKASETVKILINAT